MNIPAEFMPKLWLIAADAGMAAALLWAILRSPWKRLREPVQLHVWLGATVCLLLLWRIGATVAPGVSLHFLGATIATLMFGAGMAFVSIAIVTAAHTLTGAIDLASLALNALLLGLLPIAVSHALIRLVTRFMPPNLFVYLFVGAFFNGAAAMALTGLTAVALLAAAGAHPVDALRSDHLPYLLLLSWGEAFLTGGAVTLLAVYRPTWLHTYDQGRYLPAR